MREFRLREVLQELGIQVVNKTGKGWLVASCPFAPLGMHERGADRSPSFNVHVDDTGISGYNCFTCHSKGTIRQLVMRLEQGRQERYGNLSTRATLWETPDEFQAWDDPINTEPPPEPLLKATFIGMWPLAWEVPEARAYLESRGVTQRTAMLMEMHYDPREQRVLVPIYDRQGNLFGHNGRSILPDERFPYPAYKKSRDYGGLSKVHNLMGFQHAKRGKPVMVVEGLFALLHLYDIGADRYVTPVATMGASLSEHQRDMLAELGEPVYLCYDNDAAGEDGLYGVYNPQTQTHEGGGAVDVLKEHVPTLIPYYPQGINDPDHLWAEAIPWMIENAVLAV